MANTTLPCYQQAYRLYCKKQGHGGGDFCVTVGDDGLHLTPPNDNDASQLWYKEDVSFPLTPLKGFMLVNKFAGKGVQYSALGEQLQLGPLPSSDSLKELDLLHIGVLWAESSEDVGHGYTFLITLNSSSGDIVMDAMKGDDEIKEGTLVSICKKTNSETENWKLVPYFAPIHKLFCKKKGAGGDYCVAIKDNKLILSLPNDDDPSQVWYKESYNAGFILMNKATKKCVKYSGVIGEQLYLVEKPNDDLCENNVLWTENEDKGCEFTIIRTKTQVGVVMDAWGGEIYDGTTVSIHQNMNSDNQYWQLVPYSPPTYKLICKKDVPLGRCCISVDRDDKLILSFPNQDDPTQMWYKDSHEHGFMLVNNAVGKPIVQHAEGDQLELVDMPNCPQDTVLWTESGDLGDGYVQVRTLDKLAVVMSACLPDRHIIGGPSSVTISPHSTSDSEKWKFY